MKKLLLALLLCCAPAFAQFVPQPAGSYINAGSGWAAATSTSTLDAVTFTPMPIGLYRLNTTLNQWVPWDGGSSGGGAVTSVFGRTGVVSATTGDYQFNQIGGTISVAQQPASTMQAVGTVTANNLLKWVTSNTATSSSLSDNGTTISTTESITAPSFLGTATTANALSCGTLLGDLPYFTAATTMACLPGSTTTTTKILGQTGNGTISAAPAWLPVVGTGSPVFSNAPTVTGTWTFSGAMSVTMGTFTRFRTTGTAPTIAAGAAAGSGATATVLAGSTNQAGQITITTAGTPLANGTLATVTFNGTVTPAPLTVTLMPANAAAATAFTAIFTNIPGTTTWTISTGTTAPAVGAMTYFYVVI